MKKSGHQAFKHEYDPVPARLTGSVDVIGISSPNPGIRVTARALWDTGAECSVITPELSRALGLIHIGNARVASVGNTIPAKIAKVTVVLPCNIRIPDMRIWVCNLVPNTDILIGMDIIGRGDFAISNADGKTLFTFAVPPFEDKTDLYEKANLSNLLNKS